MLASLLRWARAEGLLAGQGDRLKDPVRAWFGNFAAHPTWHLQGPDHAERRHRRPRQHHQPHLGRALRHRRGPRGRFHHMD